MKVPDTEIPLRRAVVAALLAGLLVAVVFVLFNWTRFLLTNGGHPKLSRLLLGVLAGSVSSLVSEAPYLLAVLLVVGSNANLRAVAAGGALVYGVGFLLNVGTRTFGQFPFDLSPALLAVPLPRVWRLVAIAVAVWIAYGGGYERLIGPFEHAEHPLYAVVADRTVGSGLDLRRGILAAVVGGVIGTVGLVLSGVLFDALTATATGTTVRFSIRRVGVSLAEAPTTFLSQAAFLLAVLLVVGSRTTVRTVLTGVAVVFAVQVAMALGPAVVPPFEPVALWTPDGAVVGALVDAVFVVGIATAVWLAFQGGLESLRERKPPASVAG